MIIHPMGALMRRFVVDWLDRADVATVPEIMAADYTIDIAGVRMQGRDAYLEATSAQLARFPGLIVTVHDAIYAPGGRAALRFTEHGPSERGGSAAWRGLGLFRARDGVLVHNATEEDYLGRRRQLLEGVPDPVGPAMVAPWNEPLVEPDPEAEDVVRAWLGSGAPAQAGITYDDGRSVGDLLKGATVELRDLFSAGRRVALHAILHGCYAGGLSESPSARDIEVTFGIAGLLDVATDGSLSGHVVRDRLGVYRRLTR